MTDLTEVKKKNATNSAAVMLIRGVNPDNDAIFAYVGVEVDRLEDFIAAQQLGNFNPAEYGVIIEAGYGEPSAKVKQTMEEEYDFEHEKMIYLPTGSECSNKPSALKTDS